ncbi:nuclear transport factor 2 family protein [Paraburkholderia madseniana]|uniref:Nuclear transport factor 2 family protein n=1 Tax=Paraburkholderia madseniana TaxID=2599607 RepID=A0AAP5EVH0_9BURK|nr:MULTISPECIES: nuclear transport factor 2 family protein [Paraburkholderia]MCX4147172.1 nuclear transport factor 2 family protein [Paraburkholderia madseniana]MDN7150115.1 nuclear transport factor 2 family protein [Paraburkholderia sp. WS6]MDQ6408995.1 nuclear transport factor 2 family protein [Paraburkholderia madseniana]
MKIFFQLVVTALLFCLLGSPAFAANQDEITLKAMEQTWVTAVSNNDRVTLEKLFDDSFVETLANGARRSKSDLLLASPPAPGSSQTLMDIDVHVNGGTAVVTGINRFKPAADAQAVDYSFTDVFVRKAGDWRAVSSQLTRR